MSALLEILPSRWRTARSGSLLMRLGIIILTCLLAFYFGRNPSIRWMVLPGVAVAAWLLLLHPHWGIPLIIVSALVVPFVIGTGTGTSLNAPFLLVPALTGIWVVRMFMAGKVQVVPTSANWALGGLVVTTTLALLIGYLPWNVFATLAPFRAQVGAWGIFVFSALAFWVTANLIRDIRWLKITVFAFIGLGSLYVATLWLPLLAAVKPLFVFGSNGSLFWLWLAALAAGQALFNKQLSLRWRGVLALIAFATLLDRLMPFNRSWASGWLPTLLGVSIVGWLRWPRLTTGLAVVGVLGLLVYLPTIRAALVTGNEYSLITREAASRIILEIVRVSPIFGVGPANYYFYTPLYAILGWYVRFNSHNQYIDIVAQTGLAGLFFLAAFALTSTRTGLRLYRTTADGFSRGFAAACLGGLVGMLASGMLGDWFLPFVYNIGIAGFRSSVLGWIFLGGLVALTALERQSSAAAAPPRSLSPRDRVMDLSVIVVNWNTRDLLAACLASLFEHPPTGAFEVWVVDNASHDGSVGMVRERFPAVHLLENNANLGFAAANNQAIRASTGRYVLLFNSDALALPNALAAMVRFLDEHPPVGAAGPQLVNRDLSFQASYAHFPTLFSELALLTGLAHWWLGPYAPSPRPVPGEAPRRVDWVAGAALMVRRAAINSVGLMDEGYFLYSEETDWCWRLGRGGFPVWYLPQVKITHQAGASSQQQSARSYGLLYQSKLRFFARHYGAAAAWALRLAFLAGAALRLALWRALLLLPARAAKRPRWRLRAEQDQVLLRTCLTSPA